MKANVSMLSAFIKIRLNENLFERCSISTTKGNPMQVRRRDIDKKTKGPLLLEHAHMVRLLPSIGALPTMKDLDPVEEPQECIEHVINLRFGYENESCATPDLEWYRDMTCTIKSIEYKKATILDNLNLDYVDLINKDVDDLRKCIVSQLPQFVSNHIPSDKKSLFPGKQVTEFMSH